MRVADYCYKISIIKEAGWSTNYPSDRRKNFYNYDIFYQEIFISKQKTMHFWFEIPFFFGVYIFILSSSFQGDKFSPFSPLKDRKAIIVVASVLEHFVDQEAEAESF